MSAHYFRFWHNKFIARFEISDSYLTDMHVSVFIDGERTFDLRDVSLAVFDGNN